MADEKKILDNLKRSIDNRNGILTEASKLAQEKEAAANDPYKPIPLPTLKEAIDRSKER